MGREGDLPVRLRGENGIIESTVRFRYRDITLNNITPRFGPRYFFMCVPVGLPTKDENLKTT